MNFDLPKQVSFLDFYYIVPYLQMIFAWYTFHWFGFVWDVEYNDRFNKSKGKVIHEYNNQLLIGNLQLSSQPQTTTNFSG